MNNMNLIERVAHGYGRMVASYGRYLIETGDIKIEGRENIPADATIWYAWHGTNLLALAIHHTIAPRPTQAFVPPGIVGVSMSGWLEGAGFVPLWLPKDGTGNPGTALKSMIRGLSKEGDVVVAVDGPYGPAGRVRPGAFWLGKMTGRPVVGVGIAARPAVRVPRWDRQLVPLPKSKLAMVVGKPLYVPRAQDIDDAFLATIKDHLDEISKRAWDIL